MLSGNRNFEGRVHPQVKANYLASPPLVVAYALAGTMRHRPDERTARQGQGRQADVFLKDIWPSNKEVADVDAQRVSADMFERAVRRRVRRRRSVAGDQGRREGRLYDWDANRTYIKQPPFFESIGDDLARSSDIHGARVLAMLGDSVTTDHISPAGDIKPTAPPGTI